MNYSAWLLTLLLALQVCTASAVEVAKVKGKKALINLQGDSVSEGDMFFAIDENGKRKGLLKIGKTKGDKAIATVAKGKAQAGWKMIKRQAKGKKGDSDSMHSSSSSRSNFYIGGMLGMGKDSMSVKVTNDADEESTVDLAGNGFSIKAFLDWEIFQHLWIRGFSGMENFNGTGGSDECDGACDLKITYLTLDLIARYVFNDQSDYRFWLGGGFSLLFPMTKSSTAIEESSITNTSTLVLFAGGLDMFFSPNMYMPVSFEYARFPSSDQVTADMITGRAGLGFMF